MRKNKVLSADIETASQLQLLLKTPEYPEAQSMFEILQKAGCLADDPPNIKLHALEELYGQYSVHMLCDALKVSRGTFYNHILRNKKR